MTPEEILRGLKAKDRRALGKAITLVESQRPEQRQQAKWLLEQLEPSQGSYRIAVSGPPGVGKSTFIESFGMQIIAASHRLAVLAIDPSSSLTHGSILGDRTRMPQLSSQSSAFIRPSPAGNTLGGVARRTREAILLCEHAGFDRIIVETVGVGQSESLASSMVDFFLLLQHPNAGDDLQGIKKGILELADMVLINKADGSMLQAAERAKRDLRSAFGLVFPGNSAPEVLCCSALERTGLDDVLEIIEKILKKKQLDGSFLARRKEQASQWFDQNLRDELLFRLGTDSRFAAMVENLRRQVHTLKKSPSAAIQEVLTQFTIQISGEQNAATKTH